MIKGLCEVGYVGDFGLGKQPGALLLFSTPIRKIPSVGFTKPQHRTKNICQSDVIRIVRAVLLNVLDSP